MLASYDSLFIGGEWVRPSSSARIEVTSASTEENIGSVPEAAEADVDAAVAAARRAFDAPDGWSQWEPSARAAAIGRLAAELESRSAEMAQLVSAQNGMPISIATMLEGGFPVIVLRYLVGLLDGASFEEERPGFLGGTNIVRREPIGVVGAIVPWNYPQTLAAFKYAPALAAGCTIVMKPSPETVLDAFLLAEAIAAAGIPDGVVSIVPGGRELGAYLVEHRDVDKVAFTGSTAAGRRVAEACGRLLRPVTLELGGKSAAIVLEDADLDLAKIGNDLFAATLVNNGQTCYLGTRVLAPRSRYDEVVDTMAAFASSLAVGDALDPATQIGPMASQTHRDRVEGYVAKGNSDGARLVVGGGRPRGLDRGWFVEPTVFADVDNSSTIAQEEIFGPVLSVIAYGDEDDAIRIANDSDFGLGGSSRVNPGVHLVATRSAEQLVDVIGADPDLLVVLAAQLDVVEHVEVAVGLAVLVQPDQRAGDVERHPHRLVALVRHQRVRLARRLVDPVPGGRHPVVLQVPPLAGDRVGEDLLRMVVPVHQPGAAAQQHVAPPVLAGGDEQRPGADRLRQRRVVAVVVDGRVGDVRLRHRARPEHLRHRLELPPELRVRHNSSSVIAPRQHQRPPATTQNASPRSPPPWPEHNASSPGMSPETTAATSRTGRLAAGPRRAGGSYRVRAHHHA